jgi:hypothetical protein
MGSEAIKKKRMNDFFISLNGVLIEMITPQISPEKP